MIATRWHHSALFLVSSSASSQAVPISFRSRPTMSIQFFLGHPGFLLYPLSSQCIAWRGILESSINNTCPSHLSLLSLMMSSYFHIHCFHFFICMTGTRRRTVVLKWQAAWVAWSLLANKSLVLPDVCTYSKDNWCFSILILHSLLQFPSLEMLLIDKKSKRNS